MKNLIDTIESQYANSPNLMALLNYINDSIDPATDINAFHEKIWDITTAQGAGLDMWGRIVVIDRVLKIPSASDYFWWDQAEEDGRVWGEAPWYRQSSQESDNYILSDDAYRLLILVKAMANISDGSIATYNKMLMALFPGRGNAYVVDNLDMTLTLHFDFQLEPFEESIIITSGVFPVPCGQKFDVENATDHLYMTPGLIMKSQLIMIT